MASDQRLDGIIIATPPAFHAEMAVTSLAAGLHVLVEKPMTTSNEETRRLTDVARANCRMVVVGHTHLFSNAFRKLKEKGAELGPLKEIRSSAGNWGPYREDTNVLWDWAPHDIAMSLDLVGSDPVRSGIKRIATARLPVGPGEALEIFLEFPGGVEAVIHLSNIDTQKSRRFEATFENGTLIYDDLAEDKLRMIISPTAEGIAIPVDSSTPLEVLISEFAADIRSGTQTHPSLQLGVRVVNLLENFQKILDAV